MARCELRLPENYRPEVPSPLLVWLSPGEGSYRVRDIPKIVDFKSFAVVALPYPNTVVPRLAIMNRTIDEYWKFQKPMMEKIKAILPNTSVTNRIVAGFSSGSHVIGSGLDGNWRGFADYFTTFVLHEGGLSKQMLFPGVQPSHKVLISFGDKNSDNRFYWTLIERMRRTRGKVNVISIPDTGHELNKSSISTIRTWLQGDTTIP